MPRLRVKVVIERMHAMQEWSQDLVGSVVNFDTGERIPDMQTFKIVAGMGGPVGITGSLPYLAEVRGEITYYDPTNSGVERKQFVEVTELTIRTVKK